MGHNLTSLTLEFFDMDKHCLQGRSYIYEQKGTAAMFHHILHSLFIDGCKVSVTSFLWEFVEIQLQVNFDCSFQAEYGTLSAILWASQGLSGSGSMKLCMRNCSDSSSISSLHHVTRFDGQLPGPKHLQFWSSDWFKLIEWYDYQ